MECSFPFVIQADELAEKKKNHFISSFVLRNFALNGKQIHDQFSATTVWHVKQSFHRIDLTTIGKEQNDVVIALHHGIVMRN